MGTLDLPPTGVLNPCTKAEEMTAEAEMVEEAEGRQTVKASFWDQAAPTVPTDFPIVPEEPSGFWGVLGVP
jgi:hypothetical protein